MVSKSCKKKKKSKKKNKIKGKTSPRKGKRSSSKEGLRFLQSNRAQGRVPINLEIQYRVKHNYYIDLAQDISPGGIFIETDEPLPKGTLVELKIGHAQGPQVGPRVTAEGKVVWSQRPKEVSKGRRPGMGVEFVRIDVEGQRFIDGIINDFLRKVSII